MLPFDGSVTAAYSNCARCGCFFLGRNCPLDGSKSPWSIALSTALLNLEEAGRAPTHASLESVGFPRPMLLNVIILKFPAPMTPWEYFQPHLSTICPSCLAHYPHEMLAQSPGAAQAVHDMILRNLRPKE